MLAERDRCLLTRGQGGIHGRGRRIATPLAASRSPSDVAKVVRIEMKGSLGQVTALTDGLTAPLPTDSGPPLLPSHPG